MTIAGDCNSNGTIEVMVAPWHVVCVFQFLYWIDIYCILQYWNCILYSHIRPFQALSIDSTNWTQQFFVSFFIHSSSINSHSINSTSLWRSTLLFNRHTHRQQRLRELFHWNQDIILEGKCDNYWRLQCLWNTRGDACTMEFTVCFQYLYWIIFNFIRQIWNCKLYFHIRPFQALSID